MLKSNVLWKPVKGFPDYRVSNTGLVKKLAHTRRDTMGRVQNKAEKVLSYNRCRNKKYNHVHLYNKGKGKSFSVHRLVALAFIPNIEGKPQVNHIDGNQKNNNVDNLEWVTRSENIRHAFDNKLNKGNKGKKFSKTVLDDMERLTICTFTGEKRAELALKYKVHNKTVYNLQNGKVKYVRKILP